MMRAHRLALVSAASALMFALGVPVSIAGAAANAAGVQAWPDISGIYWTNSYSAKIQPLGGGDPPYTPAAMADYVKNMAAVKTYSLDDKARKLCTPDGVPRILESPYPFEIVESPDRGEIHILYELNHVIRLVTMTKPLPSPERSFNKRRPIPRELPLSLPLNNLASAEKEGVEYTNGELMLDHWFL
jgi:hypothetical protein